MAKRPRTDTLVKINSDGRQVMSNSLRELRFFAQAGGEATWEMIFWSLALRNLPAEVYFTPLQIHWCREHRDFDDVRVAGPERLGRAHRPTTLMLPS